MTRTAKKTDPNFAVTREDGALISEIVSRAWESVHVRDFYNDDKLALRMDITATHANGNPLRLAGLLAADDFNFFHDIGGIGRHIDRATGGLTNHFRPRFSQPAGV